MRKEKLLKSIAVVVFGLLFTSISFADIPKTLNYQGRLMNTVGQPVIDGQYSVTFRLYNAETGGDMEWSETLTVLTRNGYFNTVLGNTTLLNSEICNQPLWVEMQVGTAAAMIPRQKLSAVAYAINVADNVVTTSKIKDGEVKTADIADSSIQASKIADGQVGSSKVSPTLLYATTSTDCVVSGVGNTLVAGLSIPLNLDYPATIEIEFVGFLNNVESSAAYVQICDNESNVGYQGGVRCPTSGGGQWYTGYLMHVMDVEPNTDHNIQIKLICDGNTATMTWGSLKVTCYYRVSQ
jgi:hypothetical protein